MSHTYEAIYDDGQITWLNNPPNIRKARIQVTFVEEPVSGLSCAEELEQLKTQLLEIQPMLQETYHITELGIFGSYVRGEHTIFSDVDILVDFDPTFKLGLITFGQIEDAIGDALNKKIDLVLKRGLKPNIGKNILKEVIYLWPQERSETTSKTCSNTLPLQSTSLTI